MYDRVVNVRESYTVPFGCRGTVIGIQKSDNKSDRSGASLEDDMDVMYDVVFDQFFPGGLQLNCSPNRGYRLPKPALINLSHGLRVLANKTKVNFNATTSTVAPSVPAQQMWKQQQKQPQQILRPPSTYMSNWSNEVVPRYPVPVGMRPQMMQQQRMSAPVQFQAFFHEMQVL